MRKEKSSTGLPIDWKLVKLGESVDVLDNLRKPINSEERQKRILGKKEKELFPYFGATGQVGLIDDYLTDGEYILVGEDGAPFLDFYKNKAYKIKGKTWVNNHAHILKGKEGVSINEYVLHYLNSIDYREHVNGTTRLKLTKGSLVDIPFVLPPIDTQKAIVSKIEELFSELEKGIESLKLALQQLKVYRQSVLKWAFEGKLTEEWRHVQKNLKSGEAVVQILKQEKEVYANKIGIKQKPIPKLEPEELANLSKLPPEYSWIRLGDIVWSVKDGPHYSPKYQPSGIPFISGGNIRPEGIDFTKTKYISKELHNELSKRCKPEKGDVLYTKGGTTGIARVNTYDIDFNVWVHVAVLKQLKSINPFYLQYALNSNHCYKQSQKYTHGVGNQDLGLTRMILITLPICSLEEQNEIVQAIESRFSVIDKMEESINQGLQQSEAMRQSILKRAFEGLLI